jgi:predicted anti-sigma-YlaC factor YlaD
MDCLTIEEQLSEFIDGTLGVDQTSAVETHLKGCRSCGELHQTMVGVIGWVRSFPSFSGPEDLVPRILAQSSQISLELLPNCPVIEEQMSECIDGLLSGEDVDVVEAHLAVCGSCAEIHASMADAVRWSQSVPSYSAPGNLVSRILADSAQSKRDLVRDCSTFEDRLSEFIDGLMSGDDALMMTGHLAECGSCRQVLDAIKGVVGIGQQFPVYEAPEWLVTRIVANTPRTERETWMDTISGIGRWIVEPRMAMTVFTAVLVLGWMSNMAGIPLSPASFTNPSAVYYSVEELADDMYNWSVRFYYGVPHTVVGEIQSRIEQLRESS